MLRAFVEIDRATMGPERLAAKLGRYTRLHRYTPAPVGRRRPAMEPPVEEWRRHYPLYPRLLPPAPPGSKPASAPRTQQPRDIALTGFLRTVPVLSAPMTELRSRPPVCAMPRPQARPRPPGPRPQQVRALRTPGTGTAQPQPGDCANTVWRRIAHSPPPPRPAAHSVRIGCTSAAQPVRTWAEAPQESTQKEPWELVGICVALRLHTCTATAPDGEGT
jgi:hypothetical protein